MLEVDVSSEASVAVMVRNTVARFGTIDILVNNAGVFMPFREVVDLSLEEWERPLAVNLRGTFLCCRSVLPVMIGKRAGKTRHAWTSAPAFLTSARSLG